MCALKWVISKLILKLRGSTRIFLGITVPPQISLEVRFDWSGNSGWCKPKKYIQCVIHKKFVIKTLSDLDT